MKKVLLFMFLMSLFACSKKEHPIESRMKEWMGKEIFFPAKEDLDFLTLSAQKVKLV